jgi:hypothetical protein
MTAAVERIPLAFTLFTAVVVLAGHGLSMLSRLADQRAWLWVLGGATVVAVTAAALWPARLPALSRGHGAISSAILWPPVLTAVALAIVNLVVIVNVAPHHWDGMTYHLARLAYYLQQGDLSAFDANYWAQVVHPTNGTLLLAASYFGSSANENLTPLVQFVAYISSVAGLFAIARRAGFSTAPSAFAAAIGALLTEWLMQSTTTQNDLVVTAYLATTVWALMLYRENARRSDLALAALAIGLAIGTKASALLLLPAIAIVAIYAVWAATSTLRARLVTAGTFALLVAVSLVVFALPAGYLSNVAHYGHPIGPTSVRLMHSFEAMPAREAIAHGHRNLLRYALDFVSLDGVPPIDPVHAAQSAMRWPLDRALRSAGIDLENPAGTREPFRMDRRPLAHEDFAYWGILGFAFAIPAAAIMLVRPSGPHAMRVLIAAAVVFFVTQAYVGPYDPWRGRYFAAMAVLVVPAVAGVSDIRRAWFRYLVTAIVWAGCLSAVAAVVFRINSQLVSVSYKGVEYKSVFAMDRVEQLTRNRAEYREPLAAYEMQVPRAAVVAVFLPEDSYEYPLFGRGLTRRIIPINGFDRAATDAALRALPTHATHLLYADGYRCARATDIALGADWHLRRLTDEASRRCE